MEFVSAFLADRWYILLIALVVLFLVVRIVKTVLKWVIVLAVLAGLIFYGANYKEQLLNIGTAVGGKVAEDVKAQAFKMISEEAKDAHYKQNADGSYTVSTKSVKLTGKPGSNDVQVTFMNQTFTIKADETLNALIEQAKKNGKL